MARAVLLVTSFLISIVAAEIGLRLFSSKWAIAGFEERLWRGEAERQKGIYTADETLGYRPVLGTPYYNEYGTLPNSYPFEKPPDKTRLLFIGDSVTCRATIIDGLKARYGEQSFEYWNAGVEGFNTPQEVDYYLRWNHKIKPDHVILTFHNNDFQTTPAVYIEADDRLRVFQATSVTTTLHLWLYDHSYIYKLYRKIRSDFKARDEHFDLAVLVRDSLAKLQDRLRSDGIQLTVLLLPILSPKEEWDSYRKWSHEKALTIFKGLGLDYFDLYEPLMDALASGLDVRQETDDVWHPNRVGGLRFADYLAANGLFGRLPLQADWTVFKVGRESVQTLTCSAGEAHAGSGYLVLGSASGVDNAIRWSGLGVPLRDDDYFRFLAANPNTLISDSLGVLDAHGRATVRVVLPPALVAKYAETVLHHAVIVFRDRPLRCTFVSNPVPLRHQR